MSDDGEKALIHEALRDLRQEVRSVSAEVAGLRVEVSAMGVEAMAERLNRSEVRADEMRDKIARVMYAQTSLKRQVEKWLPYLLMLAFGGAQVSGMMLPSSASTAETPSSSVLSPQSNP